MEAKITTVMSGHTGRRHVRHDAGHVGTRSFNRDIPGTERSLTRSTQHMGTPVISKHARLKVSVTSTP